MSLSHVAVLSGPTPDTNLSPRILARGIASNPAIKQVIDETKELADAGSAKARGKMAGQLRDASVLIKDRVS